jgi:hypothetical protein
MILGLLLPRDSDYSFEVRKRDMMGSYLEFVNSVDGSLRLSPINRGQQHARRG